MMSLGYMLDNPSDLVIVGERGSIGYLKANIIPTDPVILFNVNVQTGEHYEGDRLEQEGIVIDDPMKLVDHPLYFKIVVYGVNLNENNWKGVYVEYSFLGENGKIEVILEISNLRCTKRIQPHPKEQKSNWITKNCTPFKMQTRCK